MTRDRSSAPTEHPHGPDERLARAVLRPRLRRRDPRVELRRVASARRHPASRGSSRSSSRLWWIWLSTTLFTNRFRISDMTHRLLVLAPDVPRGARRDGGARRRRQRRRVYLSLTYAGARRHRRGHVHACRADEPHHRAEYAAARAAGVDRQGLFRRRRVPWPVRVAVWFVGLAALIVSALARHPRPTAAPASTSTISSSAWARSRSSCAARRS